MERNVLLAFVLSMAVFFVYMQFFAPRPQQPVAQKTEQAPAPATQPTAAPESSIAAAPAPVPAQEAAPGAVTPTTEERTVVLENKLIEATYSNRLGMTGWRLRNYQNKAGEDKKPIDLSSADDGSALTIRLQQDAPPPTFTVENASAEAVTFAAQAGSLLERRSWKLDGYTAELEWSARNTGNSPITLHPNVLLQENINYEKQSQYETHGPIVARGKEIERPDEDDVEKKVSFSSVSWAGLDNKYFLKAVIPAKGSKEVSTGISQLNKKNDVSTVGVQVGLPAQVIPPGGEWSTSLRIYMGPKVASALGGVGAGLEESIDYGFFGFLARPLLALLKVFYGVVGNYGIAIILVTVLIKILFYPLTRKSFTAMKDMQRIQPKLEALKKKHANDKDKLNREMMQLYRTEGINPLGGCLPILLQIPVFFALYQVLLNSIELRHAPFMLWINDLSAPEHLFSISLAGFDLPFRLLPLVMGVTMVLQQKLTPSTMDKAQQQIMMIMPVMFTFLFWGFPSGLVLYWLINNVISIAQQWWITRGVTPAATA